VGVQRITGIPPGLHCAAYQDRPVLRLAVVLQRALALVALLAGLRQTVLALAEAVALRAAVAFGAAFARRAAADVFLDALIRREV